MSPTCHNKERYIPLPLTKPARSSYYTIGHRGHGGQQTFEKRSPCRLYGRSSKRTFSDVTFWDFKLRNFNPFHRSSNEAFAWVYYARTTRPVIVAMTTDNRVMRSHNSLGVGWLALLILERGQCEGLKSGISTEKRLPRLSLTCICKYLCISTLC